MIRLLTVIGHGIELLPHFIDHYQSQVDEINIIVYNSLIDFQLDLKVKNVIEKYKNVYIVNVLQDKMYDWNMVTKQYNLFKSIHPHDWWVIADIDEFHIYPNNDLKTLISECDNNGWEIVRGGFIDRVGKSGNFPWILSDIPIFEQFPMAGFFRYPMSNACPNKVCVMKGNVEITSGQHYAKIDGHTTWKWQGWNHPLISPYETHSVQVHHFKWDATCVYRIKEIAELKQDYSFSDEYSIMFNKLKDTGFKIDLDNPEYMFEQTNGSYSSLGWNKLIKKIVAI